MTRTIRKFNDTKYHLDNDVNAYRQEITALEITNIELFRQTIALQNKPRILDIKYHGS